MNQDRDELKDGQPDREPSDQNLPVEGRRSSPLARQPMEQIAGAMQIQAELLKQMHERQRMLEEVVKDNRRHELMINSAQALNESFQGLQRVQERLADRLQETSGASRGRFIIIAFALMLFAGVAGFLTWRIVNSADAINTNLKSALDPKSRDRELQEDLGKLESRVRQVEEADRAAFRDEIEKLRKGLDAISSERDMLRRERDGAREELGAAKASLGTAQSELGELKEKSLTLEQENARLAAQGLADQKTVVQLNDVIAMMKDAKAPRTPAGDETARLAAEKTAEKTAEKPVTPPSSPVSDPPPATKAGTEPASAGVEALVAFPAAQIEPLNALLKSHRGSDRYELKKAEKVGQNKLWNVAMEVRGPDGNLTKTIEAESLTFWLKGDLLEVEFEGGSVTFHQGLGGRSTKSPFFNNRYLIVVLGTNGKEWLAANQPFIRAK